MTHTLCREFWDESSVWIPHADEKDSKGAAKKPGGQTRSPGSTEMPAARFTGRPRGETGGYVLRPHPPRFGNAPLSSPTSQPKQGNPVTFRYSGQRFRRPTVERRDDAHSQKRVIARWKGHL